MHAATAPRNRIRIRPSLRLSTAGALLGIASLSVAVLPAPVAAATTAFVVTNCNSAGPGSLAAEVALANAGTNTVTFASALSSCASHTIILSGTVTINNNITITGPGAGVLAVSGNHAFTVFSVTSGAKTAATISGLTIENGFAADGGGITNLGSLQLTNDVISGNATQSGANGSGSTTVTINATSSTLNVGGGNGGDGGGIFSAGSLVLTNDTIASNSTGSGGNGPTEFTATIVGNNNTIFQDAGDGGDGAGLYNIGTVVLAGDTFSDNATGSGGTGQSDATMTFTGNNDTTLQGAGSGGTGGGIFSTGSLRLTNTTVAGNSTGSAGNGSASTLFTQTGNNDTLIQSAGGGGNGGGLYLGGSFSLSNGTVSGNSTGGAGSSVVDVNAPLNPGTNDVSDQFANYMGVAGGIFSFDTGTIEATIVANSGTSGDCWIAGTSLTDKGYNLDDDGSCQFSGVNASPSPTLDASLGSLAYNGGPTPTIALEPGSPAIDKVPAADCPATDQRGAPRTAPCDIGAYDTDFPSFAPTCPAGTLAYQLWASSSAGDFIGLFCLNAAGTGAYSQYSVPTLTQTATGTGTVDISGTTTALSASGKGLALLGETTPTFSSFTETAPAPMKTGTFTLLPVYPALALACPTPSGMVGNAYASAFVASGGLPPYGIRILADTNPSLGLVIGPNGVITGTPPTPGSTTITAQSTDSSGAAISASCSITIGPA
jgi:hypothetical protein